MDAGRLLDTAKSLVEEESALQVGIKLSTLVSTLQNLVDQPQTPQYQLGLRQALDSFISEASFRSDRDPTFAEYAKIVGADFLASRQLLQHVLDIINANSMTPAAAQQQLQALAHRRLIFFESLNELINSMSTLGIEEYVLAAGESQIGFRIPRTIFENELSGWIKELGVIKRIMTVFSELATGTSENFEIGEISTTDPLIFIEAHATTVVAVGAAVAWCLDQWKKIEEIRKVRADAARLNLSSADKADDLVALIDEKISSSINKAIEAHAAELVSPADAAGRGHEQVAGVESSLRALMQRIERGMTVELRFLPAPDGSAEDTQAFSEMSQIIPQLKFPAPSSEPTMLLEAPHDGAAKS